MEGFLPPFLSVLFFSIIFFLNFLLFSLADNNLISDLYMNIIKELEPTILKLSKKYKKDFFVADQKDLALFDDVIKYGLKILENIEIFVNQLLSQIKSDEENDKKLFDKVIYGIKNEYKSLFKSNRKNWINFNFENEKKDKNDDNIARFISEITITKPIKWNKTSFVISIFRLIFLIFIQIIIFYLCNNFNNFGEMGNIDEITKNNSFLYFVSSISLFVVSKIILYWMKLINMTYFFLERNSINPR